MSSTRIAPDGSALRPERFASSPEFERGLVASRVAALCETVDDPAIREVIWFVQFLSHQEGGLAALKEDLLRKYPERFGTRTMLNLAKNSKGEFNIGEMQAIRKELPRGERRKFPLKGESEWDMNYQMWKVPPQKDSKEDGQSLKKLADFAISDHNDCDWEKKHREAKGRELAEKHPSSYPVTILSEFCREAALSGIPPYKCNEAGTNDLERELKEMCLNPEWPFAMGGPWYFRDLIRSLAEYQADFVKSKKARVVVTVLGKQVCDALEYTASERLLTLIQGEARTGKSFSARAWCEQHCGHARFIEVPAFSSDIDFFRAIADGLGLGKRPGYKAQELRDLAQTVLLAKRQNMLLVLDEAQRLWPQSWRQRPDPKRILWVMTMANAGVPIALIATPQFIETQKAIEKAGWNAAQLTGRIGHYVPLPADLSQGDLEAVAQSVLPGVDPKVLRGLAVYAQKSSRNLAAIDSISKRARYFAKTEGRSAITTEDVKRAAKESVIPSDTKLLSALADSARVSPVATMAQEAVLEITPAFGTRATTPATESMHTAGRRAITPASIAETIET